MKTKMIFMLLFVTQFKISPHGIWHFKVFLLFLCLLLSKVFHLSLDASSSLKAWGARSVTLKKSSPICYLSLGCLELSLGMRVWILCLQIPAWHLKIEDHENWIR